MNLKGLSNFPEDVAFLIANPLRYGTLTIPAPASSYSISVPAGHQLTIFATDGSFTGPSRRGRVAPPA